MSRHKIVEIGGALRCVVCKSSTPEQLRQPCVRKTPPPPGLGDHIANALAKVGITKRRYVRAKQLLGLAPTCGCDRRKNWLNRLGKRRRKR